MVPRCSSTCCLWQTGRPTRCRQTRTSPRLDRRTLFAFLIVAVVVLARSFVKQLRKAQAARDAGVYGDPPADVTKQSRDAAPR